MHAFHLARCRNDDTAHDLTAETFAQAWLSRTRFQDEARGSAGPWLFAIARHVLFNSVRRRRLEQSARERLGLLDRIDRCRALEPDKSWLEGIDEARPSCPPVNARRSSFASSTTSTTTVWRHGSTRLRPQWLPRPHG